MVYPVVICSGLGMCICAYVCMRLSAVALPCTQSMLVEIVWADGQWIRINLFAVNKQGKVMSISFRAT